MDQHSPSNELVRAMKSRAAGLRSTAHAAGKTLRQAAALEQVARESGYRDWNGAVAAAKAAGGRFKPKSTATFLWRDPSQPLPTLAFRIVRSGSSFYDSVRALMRWATQVDLIADSLPEANRPKLLGSMTDELPYVFVQDPGRWGNDLYRLCTRGYEPWKGIAFTRDELAAAGVLEWESEHGNHGGRNMFSVAWDEPMRSHDSVTLKKLARLVAGICLLADEGYARQLGERVPFGKGFTIDLNDPAQVTTGHVARLIGSRDDSVNRELRVTKAGIAYISDVVGNVDTADLAFGLKVWIAGNGYVGLEAARDESYVREVFDTLVRNWPAPTGDDDINDWT